MERTLVGELVVETHASETDDKRGLLKVYIGRLDGRPMTMADRMDAERIYALVDEAAEMFGGSVPGKRGGWLA